MPSTEAELEAVLAIKPTRDNIIIKIAEIIDQTASGIYTGKPTRNEFAHIISVGPDVTQVSVGDKVLMELGEWRILKDYGDLFAVSKEERVIGVFAD